MDYQRLTSRDAREKRIKGCIDDRKRKEKNEKQRDCMRNLRAKRAEKAATADATPTLTPTANARRQCQTPMPNANTAKRRTRRISRPRVCSLLSLVRKVVLLVLTLDVLEEVCMLIYVLIKIELLCV
mmetsp:Transcript_10212/g.20420  ORF Transcript_10212/g.20420 Transcript_10212/m.20420 type:complete len:127 (+) Transcript_10212:1920-2300(+)